MSIPYSRHLSPLPPPTHIGMELSKYIILKGWVERERRALFDPTPTVGTHLEMQEWMTAIDAVVQGVPEQVQTRRDTVRKRCGKRPERVCVKSSMMTLCSSFEAMFTIVIRTQQQAVALQQILSST